MPFRPPFIWLLITCIVQLQKTDNAVRIVVKHYTFLYISFLYSIRRSYVSNLCLFSVKLNFKFDTCNPIILRNEKDTALKSDEIIFSVLR